MSTRSSLRRAAWVSVSAVVLLHLSVARAAEPAPPTGPVGFKITEILETTTTAAGQPIRFPQGENQLTALHRGARAWGPGRPARASCAALCLHPRRHADCRSGRTRNAHVPRRRGLRGRRESLAQRPQSWRPAGAVSGRLRRSEGHAHCNPAVSPPIVPLLCCDEHAQHRELGVLEQLHRSSAVSFCDLGLAACLLDARQPVQGLSMPNAVWIDSLPRVDQALQIIVERCIAVLAQLRPGIEEGGHPNGRPEASLCVLLAGAVERPSRLVYFG